MQPSRRAIPSPPRAHHPVVVPLEYRSGERRQEIHPGPGRRDVPLVEDRGRAILLEQAPAADPLQLPDRVGLEQERGLDLVGPELEFDPVGQDSSSSTSSTPRHHRGQCSWA